MPGDSTRVRSGRRPCHGLRRWRTPDELEHGLVLMGGRDGRVPPSEEAAVRRSLWGWCLESEEPTAADRARRAAQLAEQFRVDVKPTPLPDLNRIELRAPRLRPPVSLAGFCSTDTWERAYYSYGSHFTDYTNAFNGHYPNPVDVVDTAGRLPIPPSTR